MRNPIDVRIDFAFKKVFGSATFTDLSIALLNAMIDFPPESQITALNLLNPFSEIDFVGQKLTILDIRAQDQFNRWYDLEMQMLAQMFFRERVLFYLAKYYSQQLGEGQRYDKLTPVHGVFFLNANEWKDDRYHRVFCLRDLSTGAALNEHLFMHFIELPKFNLKLDELKTPREIWCYFLKHSTSLDPDNLPSQLTSEPIKRALEVLLMLSRNPLEALQYEAILRAQADQEIREEAVQRTSKREGAKTSLRTLVEAKFGIEHGALIDRLGANVDLATLQKLVAEVARANSLEQILPLFPTP